MCTEICEYNINASQLTRNNEDHSDSEVQRQCRGDQRGRCGGGLVTMESEGSGDGVCKWGCDRRSNVHNSNASCGINRALQNFHSPSTSMAQGTGNTQHTVSRFATKRKEERTFVQQRLREDLLNGDIVLLAPSRRNSGV